MVAYYYAGQRKIQLHPDDDHVAVAQGAAKDAGLETKVRAASDTALRSGAGVLVARRSSLTAALIKQLQDAGALLPVYRSDKALVVAMPEVRVEFDSPEERNRVIRLLATNTSGSSITEESADRFLIRPESGRGEDALDLANRIREKVKPAGVSVRFVQFVPKPNTTTR